jgi:Acyl-CoA reductase (LuxC)
MNLPNYFLADLPPEATLTAAMIGEACQTLKRNREQYVAKRSTQSLVNTIAGVAETWLQPEFPIRKLALDNGPRETRFSRATITTGLDNFFKQLTEENLNALLVQELGHPQRLDAMAANSAEQKLNRATMASGPEFLVHIAAGNIPNPALMSIVLGLLVRSAQFVKCASGTSFLSRLFAHSIYEADPKLGACLEIAEWRGGHAVLEGALFAETDCVTATGSDETLAAIRAKLPLKTRFLGYGHRVSFGCVTSGALAGFNAKKVVARAATDIVAWNQLGCLSPHVIYVEHGGGVSAEHFAEMLADELKRREEVEPRGELSTEHAAAIASRRGFYEVRAAHSPDTRMWCSKNSTAWTVVYEADGRFQTSCLNRFVYVKGASDLTNMLHGADSVRGKVSTVGLAAPEDKVEELATQLARWGVTRVCPLGQMQNPPLLWRHDGRPALGDLVTWTDWEQS